MKSCSSAGSLKCRRKAAATKSSAVAEKQRDEKPSLKKLEAWAKEWKRRLRVQDWITTIDYYRDADVSEGDRGSVGLCYANVEHKRARIRLREPDEYLPDWILDIECTLVHELIHLHYAPFEYAELWSLEGIAQEQSINILALALVNLKRGIS